MSESLFTAASALILVLILVFGYVGDNWEHEIIVEKDHCR
jgi:hypothetical protein